MCIKINHFEREYVKLFSPDDKFIGDVDELQLLDIQCQICEKNLSGYYVVYPNGVGNIDTDGEIDHVPDDLFKRELDFVFKLRRLQKDKNK